MRAEFASVSDVPHAISRAENKVDDLLSLFADSRTHEAVRGTVWAGYNALVEWADHYQEARGPAENRARAAVLGSGVAFKARARKLMLAEL
jgi:hypothetical protein